jgi:uracil phosphoribosyltransferase
VPVHVIQHAVAADALAALRDRSTPSDEFRRLSRRVSMLVAFEATRTLPVAPAEVDTPLETTRVERLSGRFVVVPVLRAGLGMVDAVLDLVPAARVGHIGLERDEQTAIARAYFSKLPPDLRGATALVVDPMLATGGSAVAALGLLERAGVAEVRLLCIVAAPEGVAAVEAAHPRVQIFTPAVDRELNARKFILPGLGDFGDRLYDTA